MKKIVCMFVVLSISTFNMAIDLQSLKTTWDETPLSTKLFTCGFIIGAAGSYYIYSKVTQKFAALEVKIQTLESDKKILEDINEKNSSFPETLNILRENSSSSLMTERVGDEGEEGLSGYCDKKYLAEEKFDLFVDGQQKINDKANTILKKLNDALEGITLRVNELEPCKKGYKEIAGVQVELLKAMGLLQDQFITLRAKMNGAFKDIDDIKKEVIQNRKNISIVLKAIRENIVYLDSSSGESSGDESEDKLEAAEEDKEDYSDEDEEESSSVLE